MAQERDSAINIRLAIVADSGALLRLLPQISSRPQGAQAQMPDHDTAQNTVHRLLTNEFIHFFVAESTNESDQTSQLVGTLIMVIVPNLTHGGQPWAQVENVVVDQTMRRHGVGRMLLHAAIEQARAAGCYKVQLISGTKPEQLAFYRSMGFATESCTGHKLYLTP
ncbi:MAG: GNAT family N-acetyltransferase [Caldilineaceae bacterium]